MWDLGNGTTSTEKEPGLKYGMCGLNAVKLFATDAQGKVSEKTFDLSVLCNFGGDHVPANTSSSF